MVFQHLIVAVDGSEFSWRSLPVAATMGKVADASVEVVTVVPEAADVAVTDKMLRDDLARLRGIAVEPKVTVLTGEVAPALARHAEQINGALIVMSAHGHGRSAAVLGSVTDELLREMFGPIMVVGPHVPLSINGLDGPYVVPLDGSEPAELAAPLSAAWSVEFGSVPLFVEVLDSDASARHPASETTYAARLAHEIAAATGHEIESEVLHGEHAGATIAAFARTVEASLIFATTHGRTGLARLRAGSVAAEIIRNAPCPVVLSRPPVLLHD